MKIYSIFIFILLLGSLESCDRKVRVTDDKKDCDYNVNAERQEIFTLIKKAIDNDDRVAYNKAINIILVKDRSFEFYYYILSMANKNNCPEAYYHLYMIMNDEVLVHEIAVNNEKMKKLSQYYLLKSYELGYEHSNSDVYRYFGNENIPKSKAYLLELLE